MESHTRKLDELGRIVLPGSIRANLGWKEKTAIDISVEGDSVVLKRSRGRCVFCGSEANLNTYKATDVCGDCCKEIAAAPNKNSDT